MFVKLGENLRRCVGSETTQWLWPYTTPNKAAGLLRYAQKDVTF